MQVTLLSRRVSEVFSSIAIDQAHEQINACIKGDGGAVGLTDRSCPNSARLALTDDSMTHVSRTRQQVAQVSFIKDVWGSMVNVTEELGNPFEDESQDLIVLHSTMNRWSFSSWSSQVGHPDMSATIWSFQYRMLYGRKPVETPIAWKRIIVFGNANCDSTIKIPISNWSFTETRYEALLRLQVKQQQREGGNNLIAFNKTLFY